MKKLIFSGCATAVVTPFKSGEPDLKNLERIIEIQIKNGVSALVVLGTTGEASTLTYEERGEILRAALSAAGGRVPIIAGCGSNCTENACRMAREASRLGCDGILSVTPYYNKGSKEGIYRHFLCIADASDVPLIVYNVPSRTGCDLTPDVVGRLAADERFVGIKEASGSAARCAEIVSSCGDEMPLYSGSDEINLPVLALGGVGCISVVSNILPHEVSALCDAVFKGKIKEASALSAKLLDVTKALFSEVNPIPVKYALSLLGYCSDEVRLPLAPLDEEKKKKLREVMKKSGFFENLSI